MDQRFCEATPQDLATSCHSRRRHGLGRLPIVLLFGAALALGANLPSWARLTRSRSVESPRRPSGWWLSFGGTQANLGVGSHALRRASQVAVPDVNLHDDEAFFGEFGSQGSEEEFPGEAAFNALEAAQLKEWSSSMSKADIFAILQDPANTGKPLKLAIAALQRGDSLDSLEDYNRALELLALRKMRKQARLVLSTMWSGKFPPNAKSYASVMRACAKAWYPNEAEDLLREMEEYEVQPDTGVYNAVISGFAQGGKSLPAVQLFEEMIRNDIPMDDGTFSAAIQACVKEGNWMKALQIFEDMLAQDLIPMTGTFNNLIMACVNGREPERALEIMRQMKTVGIRADVNTFAAAISACSVAGETDLGIQLFKEMQNRFPLSPNAFLTTLDMLIENGLSKEALEFFVNLGKAGVKPNRKLYSLGLRACARQGEGKLALEILKEMHLRRTTPQKMHLLSAMSACEESEMWVPAAKIAQEIRSNGWNLADHQVVRPYTKAIHLEAERGRFQQAFKLFNDMHEARLPVGEELYTAVIDVSSKAGESERAKKLEARKQDHMRRMFAQKITDYGRRDAWQAAIGLLDEMRDGSYQANQVTFTSAINACRNGAPWEVAVRLFETMEQEGIEPDVFTFTSLMSKLAANNKKDMVMDLMQQLKDAGLAPSALTYRHCMLASEEAGDSEGVLKLFDDMRADGHLWEPQAYLAALRATSKLKMWNATLDLFEQIQADRTAPLKKSFNYAIEACEALGMVEKAKELGVQQFKYKEDPRWAYLKQ